MPSLTTPDGAPVTLSAGDRDQINREFDRAMTAGPAEGLPAPPPRDNPAVPADPPAAVAGGSGPDAAAPKRGRGRPPKNADKARTEAAPPAVQHSDKDYTEECSGLVTLAWATVAAVPYTTPYAAVIEANEGQLVSALNNGARNNAAIRSRIEAISSGGGGLWAVQLAAVSVNMTMQGLQILRDPELRGEARAATEAKFRKFLRAQGVDVDDGAQDSTEAPTDAAVAA